MGANGIFGDESALDLLKALHIGPDFDYADKDSFLLDYIHYKKDGLDFYFVCNTSDEWVSRECAFRVQNKIPEIWDPLCGKVVPVSIYNQDDTHIHFPLSLAPYGSQLIAFRNGNQLPHYSKICFGEQHPPFLEFTEDGVLLWENGAFELQEKNQSTVIQNSVQSQTLEGPWDLYFPKNWGAPDQIELSELSSWTNSDIEGIKYFSGTATYRKTFQYDLESNPSGKRKMYLDMGDVSKVGEVWLNGQNLGVSWSMPHRFDITDIINPGENKLTVEVANTWSNRLTGDAISGKNFTNSNIAATIVPVEGLLPGNQSRVPWAKVPLIESGLLGPVKLESVVCR